MKIIPDELNLVKVIFDKFMETGSLTKTDEFLMNGHYKTKRGKEFTRFAIKAILSNPVYMIADEDAYNYLVENDVDLFADKEAFDENMVLWHTIELFSVLEKPLRRNQ